MFVSVSVTVLVSAFVSGLRSRAGVSSRPLDRPLVLSSCLLVGCGRVVSACMLLGAPGDDTFRTDLFRSFVRNDTHQEHLRD